VQTRILPPETKPLSFDALRGLAGRRAQYTRAFRNSDRDLMARCLAWGAENGFSAEEIAGDNPIPPEVTDDIGEDLDDDLTPSTERFDASRVVRLGEGPETVYVYDTAYCRDVVKIGCTTMPAIDRIVQQIATGMPGKPRLLVELKTENARTLERAIHATLAWRGHKVEGGGNEWFAVTPETVIEVARMIMGKPNHHALAPRRSFSGA
jgi:T5orf172 domain